MATPKGWRIPLVIFAFFGHCVTFIAAAGTDDILRQDLRITNIPEESVFDILNVLPEDYLRGLTKNSIDEKNYVYTIADPSYVRSGVWLTIGDQRLYVMPQATDVTVKITDFNLTSEVMVRYAIGGGVYEQVFDETATSIIKQLFSSRCFNPRSYFHENGLRSAPEAASESKETQQPAAEQTQGQTSTPQPPSESKPKQTSREAPEQQEEPKPKTAPKPQSKQVQEPTPTPKQTPTPEPEQDSDSESESETEIEAEPQSTSSVGTITVKYDDDTPTKKTVKFHPAVVSVLDTPDVDIELTSDTVSNYAESVQHAQINNYPMLCASFENKDFRWNGMFLHGLKLPISHFSKEFTVCYADINMETTNIVIMSHVEAAWIESYYQIVSRDSSNLRLEPTSDMTFFESFDKLPGATKPEVKSQHGEPYTLNADKYANEEDSPILMKKEGKTTFFSYKEAVESEADRKTFVQGFAYGNVTYTLPENHDFFMLVLSQPFVKTYFATLFTKNGPFYIVHRWSGDSSTNLNSLPMTDPQNVAKALMILKKFSHSRPTTDSSATRQGSGGDGDIVCLAIALSTTALTSQSLCKPLESLHHTEVITNTDTLTILKYKANSPPGFAILGDAIIELNGQDTGSEITIHFEHNPETPMMVMVSVGDMDTKAMRETGVGTLSFEDLPDSMHKRPATSRNVNINMADFTPSEIDGITWNHRSLENLWTIIPTKHPEFSIGNVTFHNCRVVPPPDNGYSFVVTSSKKDPDSLVVFYTYGDDASLALKLTKDTLAESPTCSMEILDYRARPIDKDDVDGMDFYTVFNIPK